MENDSEDEMLQAIPGLARIYASAWWHTAEWVAGTSLRAGSRLAHAATSGESPRELIQEAREDMRGYVRSFLGIVDPDGSVVPNAFSDLVAERRQRPKAGSSEELRRLGAELLRRSADVSDDEDAHPAYERILSELAPDEGRILRLLVEQGAQPAIDVRTAGIPPLGIGSELVAGGLNMIGAEAGCRHVDRVHRYLNNLNRLGLVWFSREPVSEQIRYQVLEAQPDALKAIKEARRAKMVYRSIHLTHFGEDFCEVCLPIDTAELEALPAQPSSLDYPTPADEAPSAQSG